MTDEPSKGDARVDKANAELKRGLKLCHSVVDDFRLKLAANSNESDATNSADEDADPIG